ncbi:MAG: cytochrome-c peroxidase [Chitinophagaceae bacterium]
MKKQFICISSIAMAMIVFVHCSKKDAVNTTVDYLSETFGNAINLSSLANYATQNRPAYIGKDNAGANAITNEKATIGRVLFYDKNLSIDNSISCASCHKQQFAFGDTAKPSKGVSGGITGRQSMRLINTRFAIESRFFWDERAATLEAQTTQPIQDHAEMGFSGQNGRPNFAALIAKLKGINYYQQLFTFAYGNTDITEQKLQECLAQFIRSIQSFDSKYDAGRAITNNPNINFPNFTAEENMGKNLFTLAPALNANGERIGGGAGCNGCHNAPEFDITPNSGNNGVIGVLSNAVLTDVNNTRSPSLRDIVNAAGQPNTPMMHNGAFTNLLQVINHYNNITPTPGNNRLDGRLRNNGLGQKLQLTLEEKYALIAFLKTLTGSNVYTDAKWSNPFK